MFKLVKHGKTKLMKSGEPFVYSDLRTANIAVNMFYVQNKESWDVVPV